MKNVSLKQHIKQEMKHNLINNNQGMFFHTECLMSRLYSNIYQLIVNGSNSHTQFHQKCLVSKIVLMFLKSLFCSFMHLFDKIL